MWAIVAHIHRTDANMFNVNAFILRGIKLFSVNGYTKLFNVSGYLGNG